MRAAKSSMVLFFVFCLLTVSSGIYAQDMKKPDAIKSETVDMLLGKWEARSYEMMGSMWTETANHYTSLNGQFLFIDLEGKDDKGQSYTGKVVMKLSSDGTLKGWSFDDWGQVFTYTGKANGNKVSIQGKGDWGSDTRDIEINGNTMVHKVSITMPGKDGKDMTVNQTITYDKK
jgi:hypothetical protein